MHSSQLNNQSWGMLPILLVAIFFCIPYADAFYIIPSVWTLTSFVIMSFILIWFFVVGNRAGLFCCDAWVIVSVVCLFLWSVCSLVWTVDYQATLFTNIKFLYRFLLLVAAYDVFRRMDFFQLRCLGIAWVLGALISLALLNISYFQHFNNAGNRITLLNYNANQRAFLLLFGVGFSLWGYIRSQNKWGLVFYGGASLCLIVGMLLAGSRSAFVGLLFVLLGYMLTKEDKGYYKKPVILGIIIIPFLIVSVTYLARLGIDNIYTSIFYGTMSKRSYIWQIGLHLFTQNPILGYGNGGSVFVILDPLNKNAHNIVIFMLTTLGLPGLFMFAAFFIAGTRAFFYFYSKRTVYADHLFLVFSLSSSLLIALMTQNWFLNKAVWLLLPYMLALKANVEWGYEKGV